MSLASVFSAALLTLALSGPSFAQSPAEKAQQAIGTYISVISVAKTCKFEVAEPIRNAVEANMRALQAPSGLTDAQIETAIKDGSAKVEANSAQICSMDKAKFEGFMSGQFELASAAAKAAGVTPTPIPFAAAPAPAAPAAPAAGDKEKQAKEMLLLSHLLEAVADECEIELSDDETSKLEKAQAYFRGQAGVTEAQVTAMTDAMETEVEKGHKEFCSPKFEFKTMLKSVLESAK
ncbi:MAG: hypothetical protein K2P80_02620 [Beijerinckiaceae bacterium]|nr:hypothetical protein [Beijerinckiaceae bacterium]